MRRWVFAAVSAITVIGFAVLVTSTGRERAYAGVPCNPTPPVTPAACEPTARPGLPLAPSNLTWGSSAISWQDNSDNETGFRLEKLIRGEWLDVSTYPADTTSAPFPSTGYDPGCYIPLRLFAFNGAGDSAPSEEIDYAVPPTPPPSGCPFTDYLTFTNDSGLTANRLVLPQPFGYQTIELLENAPGCPEPIVQYISQPQAYFWEVLWPLPCVDPGESVMLLGTGTGPSVVLTDEWSLAEPTPTPPPTTPTPTPTQPAPTPTLTLTGVSAQPTLTPSPSPVLTPASLPIAGSSPSDPRHAYPLLAFGVVLLLVAAASFKRIR